MNKLTTWAKHHKIAATFAGIGAALVAGLALIVTLGLIFVSTGMVEPEPVTQEAEPAKTEAKKVEKKATPKTTKPTPKKTQEPAEAEPPAPKTEKPKKAAPKPKADPLDDKLKATQKDLDTWFEDCAWDNDKFNNGIADYVTSVCASENLGIVISSSDVATESFLRGAAEEAPLGKYFIDDGMAVWSTSGGTLNLAWDALGAPGTPEDMADLVK